MLPDAVTADINAAVRPTVKASATHLPFKRGVFSDVAMRAPSEGVFGARFIRATASEVGRVLRPGGRLLVQDVNKVLGVGANKISRPRISERLQQVFGTRPYPIQDPRGGGRIMVFQRR